MGAPPAVPKPPHLSNSSRVRKSHSVQNVVNLTLPSGRSLGARFTPEVVVVSSPPAETASPSNSSSGLSIFKYAEATVTLPSAHFRRSPGQVCFVDLSDARDWPTPVSTPLEPSSAENSKRVSKCDQTSKSPSNQTPESPSNQTPDSPSNQTPDSPRERQAFKRRRALARQNRFKASRRRSGESLVTRTVDPSLGEERYRRVATLNYGVEVRDSTIPSAGRGLFASRDFKKGELVTEYVGEIITRDEARRRLRRGMFHYLGTLVTGMYEIDGIKEPQEGVGAASFINHARRPHANCVWAHAEDKRACFRRMFAKACRNVAAGEELFLDYGKTYWAHHKRWKLALEKGCDMLSDETLTEDEDGDGDTARGFRQGETIEIVGSSDEDQQTTSPKVELSSESCLTAEDSSSSVDLTLLAKEFHLRPCEPPLKKWRTVS
eukprot:Gregarina_sp_Pseudo_9__1100@NODE_1717_length_1371_cov_29_033033_g1591_i0_p1_GENE_NODE_1717_length_1371_cov_29_033033_g1591_i0NODE_1717_length_1371_cov_29_033033_g1591_i0_p1_ORF_typecomplete_len435_score63_22SET/PF00856_28/1_4e03SET/PF00856_28/6_6e15_NODE_1717_length_1371_cov_29_033033_g1591_i0311335